MLTGTIATELGLLTKLRYFTLEGSSIGGTIPSELGQFTSQKFSVLTLANLRLTGTIPTEVFGLKAEHYLLYQNMLSGPIPTEIGLATNASEYSCWKLFVICDLSAFLKPFLLLIILLTIV